MSLVLFRAFVLAVLVLDDVLHVGTVERVDSVACDAAVDSGLIGRLSDFEFTSTGSVPYVLIGSFFLRR